jgi:hypothetical protein
MASVSTRWWGVIVSLNREEGCFAATGSPAGEALLNAIPPPWGQIVLLAVKVHKFWIGANMGTEGIDLHFNWGGFLHYVGRRGDPQACTDATPRAEAPARPRGATTKRAAWSR